jgi:metal-responsive CopG/Arc/MetJ family transcriptional regulator
MTVQYHKITISLPGNLLEYADRRAQRARLSRSQVISEALAEAQAQEQMRLAAEGYRFYAGEASEFAEASAGAVAEALQASPRAGDADGREAW